MTQDINVGCRCSPCDPSIRNVVGERTLCNGGELQQFLLGQTGCQRMQRGRAICLSCLHVSISGVWRDMS